MVSRDQAHYSRTECVYLSGRPEERHSEGGTVLHYRNFPYLGIFSDGSGQIGTNRGMVDIDLNQETGSGSISGTLSIRDTVMGDFDGRFSGDYTNGLWQGTGSAIGVDAALGRRLEMDLQAFDPTGCPAHADHGRAVDGAFWTVVIAGPDA